MCGIFLGKVAPQCHNSSIVGVERLWRSLLQSSYVSESYTVESMAQLGSKHQIVSAVVDVWADHKSSTPLAKRKFYDPGWWFFGHLLFACSGLVAEGI